ncbi:MAG: glycosyltransferase family 4 protein [Dysgonomonas sp.]
MRIGIAAPIKVSSLKEHFVNLSQKDLSLGLGGTAINILIDGFIKAGHKVTVFTLDPTITDKYVLEGDNLKIIFGYFRCSGREKTFDLGKTEIFQIKTFILEEKRNIDIVNAHWSYEFAIGTILAKVPHLITFRDHAQTVLKMVPRPFIFIRLFMDKWVRKNAQNICYNSPYLKAKIKKGGMVIPNPITEKEIMRARKYPKDKDIFKIYYIANGWDKIKNPTIAIEAFYILRKEILNVELYLIGKGAEPNGPNHTLIKKRGLGENVFFRGSIGHEELIQELEIADILLHTSREESFGNTLIEAMAKGIPTVAGKKSGAVPWVLADGAAGMLVDIESAEDVAQALITLIKDEDKYECISTCGIRNVKERFSQLKVCAAYITAYQNILNAD